MAGSDSASAQPHWLLVAVLAIGLALALAAPQQAQAVDCNTALCLKLKRTTDGDGQASLVIEANQVGEFVKELDGCTWHVDVEFGDGSESEELVFEEEALFVASHTFPEPGNYLMVIDATKGVRSDLSKCPDVHIEVTVTYPKPAPPEEPEEPAPEGPKDPPAGQGVGASGAPPPTLPAPTPAPPRSSPFWRACGGGVLAHRASCSKARRVLRAARHLLSRARLKQGATFEAAGFDCRLRGNGSISCRHSRQRVLGT